MKKLLLNLWFLFILITGCTQPNDLGKKAEASLKKSAYYFRALGTDIDRRDVVMMLFILKEHFNYPLDLLPLDEFKERDPELAGSYFKLYDTYFEGRNVPLFPDSVIMKFLMSNLNTLDGLTVWSLFCNKFPLPESYLNILNENIARGGYEMTHAALQLGNILQLDCISKEEAEKLREKLVEGLMSQINSNTVLAYSDDMKYECLSMLYYLGKDDLISQGHIRYIIDSQMSNGGWSPSVKENQGTNVHTSVLALWVLLEYYSRNR